MNPSQTLRARNAYDPRVQRIRTQIEGAVRRAWGSLGSYRDADIARFASAVVPLVVAGERTVAQLTREYLVQAGADPDRLDTASVTGEATRGVDPLDVYRRPGVTVWTALAGGASLDAAVTRGGVRAVSLALTDLQLARTRTVAQVGVTRFRRTLSGLENCAVCELASQNVYYRGDLMPIHAGCDCGVEPVTVQVDVTPPSGVTVHQHGELGPVLTVEGHEFTGPLDF